MKEESFYKKDKLEVEILGDSKVSEKFCLSGRGLRQKAKDLAKALKKDTEVKELKVYLSFRGGGLDKGEAQFSLLRFG